MKNETNPGGQGDQKRSEDRPEIEKRNPQPKHDVQGDKPKQGDPRSKESGGSGGQGASEGGRGRLQE